MMCHGSASTIVQNIRSTKNSTAFVVGTRSVVDFASGFLISNTHYGYGGTTILSRFMLSQTQGSIKFINSSASTVET